MTLMPDEAFQWEEIVLTDPPPPDPDPTYEDITLTDSPLGYWRMDDTSGTTLTDSSGNARHMALTGTYTLGEPPLIGIGTAVNFDGSSGYASIAADTWMDLAHMTIEAWVKPDVVSGATDIICGRTNLGSASDANYQFYLKRNSSAGWGFLLRTGNNNIDINGAASAAVAGQVVHIVGTYDNVTVRLYVNGVQVASQAAAGGGGGMSDGQLQPFRIGGINNTSNRFDGTIDEVAWYGTALSAARILEKYDAGPVGEPPPPEDPDPIEEWVEVPDRTAGLVSLDVQYGASDAVTRALPLRAGVELAEQVAGDCPPVGERFRISLTEAAATALGLTGDEAILFTGEVTDPSIDPRRGVHSITAAGRLGRANRRTLATTDWPVQIDGDRVARIMARAEIEAGDLDPGTVDLATPDSDVTAFSLLEAVTDSTGGSVVEQLTGLVDYHDANHRRDTGVTVTLTTGQVSSAITWEQHVDDVLNEVEVSWPGGTVIARDPGSIDARGTYPGRRSTALTSASDAHSLGQLVVGRRSEPVWQLPNLEVDLMHMVDDTLRGQLLLLRRGDRIEVTGVPGPHPYSGDVEFFVEGWHMNVVKPYQGRPWRWKLTLSVSDPALSGVSIRWIDLETGFAWDDFDPGLSWLDLARIEDPADL